MAIAEAQQEIRGTELHLTVRTCPKCKEGFTEEELDTAAWICPACGGSNTGKFCEYCGTPRP